MPATTKSLGPATFCTTPLPFGHAAVLCDGEALLGCTMGETPDITVPWRQAGFTEASGELHHTVLAELEGRFAGELETITPGWRLAPAGTAFQQRVWAALQTIPRATTWSYAALAATLGAPNAIRAVARAVGANPIAVFVPCHRVIGSRGDLTGYRWGLDLKRRLLVAEGALVA